MPQSTDGITYARKISKEDGRIDWTLADGLLLIVDRLNCVIHHQLSIIHSVLLVFVAVVVLPVVAVEIVAAFFIP